MAQVGIRPGDLRLLAQCQGWQALFDATGGQDWTRCAAYRSDPCACEAEGTGGVESSEVVCQGANIVAIKIYENNAKGTLPTEIGQLSMLTAFLRLGRNALSGTLPTELGQLTSLRWFNIEENRFDFVSGGSVLVHVTANR